MKVQITVDLVGKDELEKTQTNGDKEGISYPLRSRKTIVNSEGVTETLAVVYLANFKPFFCKSTNVR